MSICLFVLFHVGYDLRVQGISCHLHCTDWGISPVCIFPYFFTCGPPNEPAGMRDETTTDDPARGGTSGVQPTKEGTRHPLLIELHWLPVSARFKFKSLMLTYRGLAGSAPTYLNALVRANVTPRMLRSSSERRLALPSVQVRESTLFSFVVPCWWNELPNTTRAGASLSTFK